MPKQWLVNNQNDTPEVLQVAKSSDIHASATIYPTPPAHNRSALCRTNIQDCVELSRYLVENVLAQEGTECERCPTKGRESTAKDGRAGKAAAGLK